MSSLMTKGLWPISVSTTHKQTIIQDLSQKCIYTHSLHIDILKIDTLKYLINILKIWSKERDHLACQKSLSPNLCFSAKCFTVPVCTSCFKAVQKEKGPQMVIRFWSLVWSLNEFPHCQEGLSGWYLDLSWIFQILWMVSEMTQLPTWFDSYWAHSVGQALLGVRSINTDHADSAVAHSYVQFLCCFQPCTIIFCKQESFGLRSSSFMISFLANLNNVILFIFF